MMIETSIYRTNCVPLVMITLLIIDHRLIVVDSRVQALPKAMENKYLIRELSKETPEQMNIPVDHEQIVRLPSNSLLKYTSYKDVAILHFRVPPDSRAAYFTFKAFEESKNAFKRKCKAKDVTLHLKASSYPVISPENITFPKNFFSPEQRFKVHSLQFQSNDLQQRIDIQGPHIGNWFAVAFVSWTDPNNDRIEQQGLAASCDSLLLAELSVTRFRPISVNNGQVHNGNLTNYDIAQEGDEDERLSLHGTQNQLQQLSIKTKRNAQLQNFTHNNPTSGSKSDEHKLHDSGRSNDATTGNNEITYKFYVPDNVGVATARISFLKVCVHCPDVGFYVQANAYPQKNIEYSEDEQNKIHITVIRANQTKEISIQFCVQPSTWHYAKLKFVGKAEQAKYGAGKKKILTKGDEETDPFSETERSLLKKLIDNSKLDVPENVSYSIKIDFHLPEPISVLKRKNMQGDKDTNSFNAWSPTRFRNMNFYSLLRQTYREFFMFDYDLKPDENGTVPAVLNLTTESASGFSFDLGEVNDIGGTLTFAVSMKHALHTNTEVKLLPPKLSPASERGGILAEKLISDPNDTVLPKFNNHSIQIIVCMQLGEPGVPTWPDKCRYGQHLRHASKIVNNTDSVGLIHVPFPESGRWYVTMGLYCHGAETARGTLIDNIKEFVGHHKNLLMEMRPPCPCASAAKEYDACIKSPDCLAGMNETETFKVKECLMDYQCTSNYDMTGLFKIHHKTAMEEHIEDNNCNTSVVFSVSSSPCVGGSCGHFGRCYHYMSGGFVFSTCVCMKGYRGWDCTEDSQVPTNMSILLASLLLTLSNLIFVPSIYVALSRRYFTEGIIYFFAMFFSTFYHACDSGEDEYSFCLVKIGVLQFCDFYCGLLAIWVTLVAMADVRQQFASPLHMFGAILLAFGTELNKQSLWVFLAPALTGICLISTSWGFRCAKTRKMFPSRRYLTVWLPFGICLVCVGLVCYAFLQTKQNYHIVHSIWHIVMALSILCLLPSRSTAKC
ncbi:uncharacterized protein LOC108156266 [Drosophila miranda]|uniref:uncharacterized protein LOC108156266 n=1 Tax=Drosophila miranda TaxID=7229 RepID=UPI0007E69308|nr:uncharacterized protein LOC108156266 [Drosophila miranda]XP_017143121.1 uncharacterized protein LOC108156266 [Drosophila miranda]XP_033244535.1 uncharacterized protein LOC108156266 [Drosophila miranda]XP_033244536.1 uncharacterized protein LOC108156266 [Drosophila miranda]XP_033244537.1 uncharacterized protein LOC108156266 [Drosophila miranda]